jgi:SAM-dependent methyltransferase
MGDRIERIEVRDGYDLWSQIYDERASTLVALDRRHALRHLRPQTGERILDAGCGTGAHVRSLIQSGARPVGLDFSAGMLAVARRSDPKALLLRADLRRPVPLQDAQFDAVLCTLVSEHLSNLEQFFNDLFSVLRQGGRLVFSAFHPSMAAAGVEANFEIEGTEYRLGAELHTLVDYLESIRGAGFEEVRWCEYEVDSDLVAEAPSAAKHLGEPLLLMIEAERRT